MGSTWCARPRRQSGMLDQRAHSNRNLRFQGFCRSIRLIERVFWSFYSTVRSDMQYCLAFPWPYNLLSDKVLRITVYSCANVPAGPRWAPPLRAPRGVTPPHPATAVALLEQRPSPCPSLHTGPTLSHHAGGRRVPRAGGGSGAQDPLRLDI